LLDAGALIEAKADTNLWDGPRHWTPISFAAYRGHEAIVRLLAGRGADTRYTDEQGCNPIRLCLIDAHDKRASWPAARALVAFLRSSGTPVDEPSLAFVAQMDAAEKREETIRRNRVALPKRNADHEYFVLGNPAGESWFAVASLPDGPASYEWSDNVPLKDRVAANATVGFGTHALDRKPNFKKELRAGLILRDVLATICRALIVSPRTRALLEAERVTNVEYIAVRVQSPEGEVIADDYCVVNPIASEDAIDRERSELTMSATTKTDIRAIDHLVIDRANIDENAKLFRSTDYSAHFFLRGDLRAAFEKAGLTGWNTAPADDWDGLLL
jgi:hypothetical protein